MSNSTNVTTVTVMSNNIRDNPDMKFYVRIYGLGVIAIVILMLLRAVIFMKVNNIIIFFTHFTYWCHYFVPFLLCFVPLFDRVHVN
jgi:hypothetical protein